MNANIKIGGSTTINVEADNPIDLIKGMAQFSQLPTKCGHCGKDSLSFQHRTAGQGGEYSYITLQCNDCGAAFDVGQTKTGGGIFPNFTPKDKTNCKSGWYYWKEQAYAQQNNQGGGQPQQQAKTPTQESADANGGDLPF